MSPTRKAASLADDDVMLDVAGVAKVLHVQPKTVYFHAPHWDFMFKPKGSRLWRAWLSDVRRAMRKDTKPALEPRAPARLGVANGRPRKR